MKLFTIAALFFSVVATGAQAQSPVPNTPKAAPQILYKLSLTEAQAGTVLRALGKLTLEEAIDTFMAVRSQLAAQVEASGASRTQPELAKPPKVDAPHSEAAPEASAPH